GQSGDCDATRDGNGWYKEGIDGHQCRENQRDEEECSSVASADELYARQCQGDEQTQPCKRCFAAVEEELHEERTAEQDSASRRRNGRPLGEVAHAREGAKARQHQQDKQESALRLCARGVDQPVDVCEEW